MTFRSGSRVALALVALAAPCALPLAEGAQAPQAGQAPGTTTVPKVPLTTGRPTIADAVVVRPREILIDGKNPGTISLIVWGADTRTQFDIVVEQPISSLEQ